MYLKFHSVFYHFIFIFSFFFQLKHIFFDLKKIFFQYSFIIKVAFNFLSPILIFYLRFIIYSCYMGRSQTCLHLLSKLVTIPLFLKIPQERENPLKRRHAVFFFPCVLLVLVKAKIQNVSPKSKGLGLVLSQNRNKTGVGVGVGGVLMM